MLLFGSIIVFALLLGLSVYFESTKLIFVASAFPILIVAFLPDIKTSQYIRLSKSGQDVTITRTPAESGLIVISFSNRSLSWKKRTLYFHIEDIRNAPIVQAAPEEAAASIPVLKFDLLTHSRRKAWIGIQLNNLAERTEGMSFTTDEVNRLVLQLSDVEQLMPLSAPAAAAQNSIQA
jgi:hypothetical protein